MNDFRFALRQMLQLSASAVAATFFLATALLSTGPVQAETDAGGLFDGICIDAGECSGVVSIEDDAFPWCEESCQLQNPTAVKGMDAVLYDVQCNSDHAGATSQRMFFAKFGSGLNDGTIGAITTNDGTYPLVTCARSADAGLQIPEVEALTKRFFEYADLCRGGGGDEPDVEKRILLQEEGCAEWAKTEIELNQTYGVCFGTQDQATADYDWHKCGMNSNYHPFEIFD